jgi:flagellar assembly factor FliW
MDYMNTNTKFHGIREYKEEDILVFKKGLPGFEELKKFILFPVEDGEVFNILHSIEDEGIGLVVISPYNIDRNYEIKLSEGLIEELEIEKEADVLLLNTVTLNSAMENITVNMKAPIIINIFKGLGEQIILEDDKYFIKHPLIQE